MAAAFRMAIVFIQLRKQVLHNRSHKILFTLCNFAGQRKWLPDAMMKAHKHGLSVTKKLKPGAVLLHKSFHISILIILNLLVISPYLKAFVYLFSFFALYRTYCTHFSTFLLMQSFWYQSPLFYRQRRRNRFLCQ